MNRMIIKGKKVSAVAAPSPKTMDVFVVSGYPDFIPTKDQLPIAVDFNPEDSASPIIYMCDREDEKWYVIETGISSLNEITLNIPGAEATVKLGAFYSILGGEIIEGFVTVDEVKRKIKAELKEEILNELKDSQ